MPARSEPQKVTWTVPLEVGLVAEFTTVPSETWPWGSATWISSRHSRVPGLTRRS